ncbi:hypothetical protein BGW38_006134 [Lunasporangiospora selenospora]|uniref:Nucleosome assembly protein n=1 Tax=Lunasporangiospora selenospora TaxID=979761 RepID=A0A9P6G1E1_9FUNG|nr:hypothetical protein BGW38_006134 [Lunasporangiospora selenospora]
MDPATRSSILAQNPQLMSMLQGRLGNLVGAPSGYIDSLPAPVRRRINGLKSLQKKHTSMETDFQKEILEIEKKYLALYTPLYLKRAEVISGKTEPTDAEVEDGVSDDEDEKDEDEDEDEDDKETQKIEGIPEFWLTALKNHPQISDLITERDDAALKHLVDIRILYLEKPGFKLEFEFSPNEYFSNTTLTKTYYYQDELGYGGGFVYDRAEGSTIEWKQDKDLTVTVETKKQRHKGSSKTRVVKRTVPAETFFTFFTPPKVPGEDDAHDDEDDDEDVDEDLDERLEGDYQLGEEIKDSIVPRAVDWFTGKALQYGGHDDQYEDDFEYDDEDEEDEEDDDEDDDDDVDEGSYR